jgi:DNA processing protein
MKDEAKYYNALCQHFKGDYLKIRKAKENYQSWRLAYENSKGKLPDIDEAWAKIEKHDIKLILESETEFPALLREIPFPPFGLYYKGAPIGDEIKLAIVGTRKVSPIGINIAKKFGADLALSKITSVSGLALGVDASSHEGALSVGGKTLAVLARGLDDIYPKQNERLANKILTTGGTLISEYPPGEPPYQNRFLERNRIVSGMSVGVLVIEAPERSGTLATSRFAVEQNRELFVIPGNINNPNYTGSNSLIKSGACLVTEVRDILEPLGLWNELTDKKKALILPENLDENQKNIYEVLHKNGEPMHTDEIIAKINLKESIINESLVMLVLSGHIKEISGKYYI